MVRVVQSYSQYLARARNRRKQGWIADRRTRALFYPLRNGSFYLLPALDNADQVGWRFGKKLAERNNKIIDHNAGFRSSVARRKTHQLHCLFLSTIVYLRGTASTLKPPVSTPRFMPVQD
jgi:hypothetical protein